MLRARMRLRLYALVAMVLASSTKSTNEVLTLIFSWYIYFVSYVNTVKIHCVTTNFDLIMYNIVCISRYSRAFYNVAFQILQSMNISFYKNFNEF